MRALLVILCALPASASAEVAVHGAAGPTVAFVEDWAGRGTDVAPALSLDLGVAVTIADQVSLDLTATAMLRSVDCTLGREPPFDEGCGKLERAARAVLAVERSWDGRFRPAVGLGIGWQRLWRSDVLTQSPGELVEIYSRSFPYVDDLAIVGRARVGLPLGRGWRLELTVQLSEVVTRIHEESRGGPRPVITSGGVSTPTAYPGLPERSFVSVEIPLGVRSTF